MEPDELEMQIARAVLAEERCREGDEAIRIAVEALKSIRDGYGPDHLSKFARNTAATALAAISEATQKEEER